MTQASVGQLTGGGGADIMASAQYWRWVTRYLLPRERHWQHTEKRPDDVTPGSKVDKGRPKGLSPLHVPPFFCYPNTK